MHYQPRTNLAVACLTQNVPRKGFFDLDYVLSDNLKIFVSMQKHLQATKNCRRHRRQMAMRSTHSYLSLFSCDPVIGFHWEAFRESYWCHLIETCLISCLSACLSDFCALNPYLLSLYWENYFSGCKFSRGEIHSGRKPSNCFRLLHSCIYFEIMAVETKKNMHGLIA